MDIFDKALARARATREARDAACKEALEKRPENVGRFIRALTGTSSK